MRLCLEDQADTGKVVHIIVEFEGGQICIRPQGYGDRTSPDGQGFPIVVELIDGEVRVAVWPDINEEEPVLISLEGARESKRRI